MCESDLRNFKNDLTLNPQSEKIIEKYELITGKTILKKDYHNIKQSMTSNILNINEAVKRIGNLTRLLAKIVFILLCTRHTQKLNFCFIADIFEFIVSKDSLGCQAHKRAGEMRNLYSWPGLIGQCNEQGNAIFFFGPGRVRAAYRALKAW